MAGAAIAPWYAPSGAIGAAIAAEWIPPYPKPPYPPYPPYAPYPTPKTPRLSCFFSAASSMAAAEAAATKNNTINCTTEIKIKGNQ